MEFNRFGAHDMWGSFQPMRCCFDGRYKLAINLMETDELYDLQDDPGEMVNLIDSADHALLRDKLHDRLIKWMNDTIDPLGGYYWERRPWRPDARQPYYNNGQYRYRPREVDEPSLLNYATGLEFESEDKPE